MTPPLEAAILIRIDDMTPGAERTVGQLAKRFALDPADPDASIEDLISAALDEAPNVTEWSQSGF